MTGALAAVTAERDRLLAELSALASLVDSAVSTIVSKFNAHTHILALTAGTGTAAPPATPMQISPAPGSVAATVLKAK